MINPQITYRGMEHSPAFDDLALLGESGEAEDLDPGEADRAALETGA